MYSIVVHHFLAVNEEERSIVGGGCEIVFPILWAFNFTNKDKTEVVVAVAWSDVE